MNYYLLLTLFESVGPEALWSVLGRKSSQLFGKECAGAALSMFFSLFLRSLTVRLGLSTPHGIIFALPIFFQVLSTFFPFMKEFVPLLTIRLAESILGRISPIQLLVVFPAHFLGCILGTFFFCAICPSKFAALDPITYHVSLIPAMGTEVFVVALYTVLFLVIPELLSVNRMSKKWLSIFVFPCFFLTPFADSPTLNPTSLYSLWYLQNKMEASGIPAIQVEHLIGPILGALLAGFICLKLFPDDPSSWKRSFLL